MKLLVVDDDPLLLKSLFDTLSGDGHTVTTANGGKPGIDAFLAARKGDKPFDVVITDLGMPYVDGRKVAAAIHQAHAATPVILLTGWGQRMLAEGDIPPYVYRVLSKPPKLLDLRVVLAECAKNQAKPDA
jgi:DNA-binding NtrC family response regulator